jgi:hypothetical protein
MTLGVNLGTMLGMTVFTDEERETFAELLASDETYTATSDPSGLLINVLVDEDYPGEDEA